MGILVCFFAPEAVLEPHVLSLILRHVSRPPPISISRSSLSLASTWQKSFTSTATQRAMAFNVPAAQWWLPAAPWCAFDSPGETDATRQRICSGLVWRELCAGGALRENSRGRQNCWTHNKPGGIKPTAEVHSRKPSLCSARSHKFTFTQQTHSSHVIFTHAIAAWMLPYFYPPKFTIFLIRFSQISLHIHTYFIQISHMETFSHLKHIFHVRGSLFLQNKSELMIRWVRMWTVKMVWGSELQRLLFTQA